MDINDILNLKLIDNLDYLYHNDKLGHPKQSEDDVKYKEALEEWNKAEKKVIVNNLSLVYDSCGCEGGCSHGQWLSAICINSDEISCSDVMEFEKGNKYLRIEKYEEDLTIGQFIDACKFMGIEIKLKPQYEMVK